MVKYEDVYVYLIESITDNIRQYKIGISNNPEKRIKTFKTGNPNIVGIVDKYLCESRLMAHRVESWYHKRQNKDLIKGEWFSMTEKEIEDFNKNCRYYENLIKIHFELEQKIKGKDIEHRIWK